MKAKLAAEAAAKKKQAEAEAEQQAAEVAESADGNAEDSNRADNTASSDNDQAGAIAADNGKAQVVSDLAAAEAMADQPALESPADDTADVAPDIAFDPSIEITPADPELGLAVSFDQTDTAPETSFSIETDTAATTDQVMAPGELLPPLALPEDPKTLEELLAEAEAAEMDRDYLSAIRKYWAAISIVNNQADIWNRLSRAYLIDGQLQNADTTALEAVRLAPGEVAFTLDFLRVARSREPKEFLAQLETAYDRFPASPEITLSLARAHERISRNTVVARNLYLRFIDIAPNHPLVPEARQAAQRLQ